MANTCHLISQRDNIPNQVLRVGQSIVIGRNRQCRIRDLQCSRSHCSVSFDGRSLSVDSKKFKDTKYLLSGQFLKGPAFEYKIVYVNQPNDVNIKEQSTEGSDDKVFSCGELLTPKSNQNIKIQNNETVWQMCCSGHVHICKFLGGGESSSSIAAFDFDGTLVDTKSGGAFPKDKEDWELFDTSLSKRIAKLVANGFRFVIISNQLPLSQGRYKLEDIQYRFEGALTAIGVPCLVMIAAFDDIYRKPRPGLWRLLADLFNDKPIDLKTSFYVGDAAGRKKVLLNKGRSDHSSADLLFAANSNIPFITPQNYYRDGKPKGWDSTKTSYSDLTINTFRPQKSNTSYIGTKLVNSTDKLFKSPQPDNHFKDINHLLANYSGKLHVIVMCGLSASGKTSFFANHLKNLNYFHISRDSLKTIEKCQKVCEHQLKNKSNCVIDNTNVEPSARKKWVDICCKYGAIPILFHFDISAKQALHNNKFRRVIGVNSPVTDLVIHSQNKQFVRPTVSEGFESIFTINFVPKFAEEEHQSIYFMYLSER